MDYMIFLVDGLYDFLLGETMLTRFLLNITINQIMEHRTLQWIQWIESYVNPFCYYFVLRETPTNN